MRASEFSALIIFSFPTCCLSNKLIRIPILPINPNETEQLHFVLCDLRTGFWLLWVKQYVLMISSTGLLHADPYLSKLRASLAFLDMLVSRHLRVCTCDCLQIDHACACWYAAAVSELSFSWWLHKLVGNFELVKSNKRP
ncbi:hypothetical protein Plhal304r1_c019g0068631 [Plasmopara halstedii]